MCVSVCLHVYAPPGLCLVPTEATSTSDLLETQLWTVVAVMWVLETKPGRSGKAASALHH